MVCESYTKNRNPRLGSHQRHLSTSKWVPPPSPLPHHHYHNYLLLLLLLEESFFTVKGGNKE